MNIVFVGLPGVPRRKRACDARLLATANLLAEKHNVCILNRFSLMPPATNAELGLMENVNIVESVPWFKCYRVFTSIVFLLGLCLEPYHLWQMNSKQHIDILHVYSGHYIDYLMYRIISRILRCKVVYQYVEYRSAFHWDNGRKKNWIVTQYHRLNGYLCDHYGAKLWDGCIAISDFLYQKAMAVNPHLKVLKVTPLCDMESFPSTGSGQAQLRTGSFEQNSLPNPVGKPYIFYCGNREYLDVAETIERAFEQSRLKGKMKLVMHISGQLPYEQLVAYYKHAEALLIPLRNEIADIARFPNKVCEYCAARGVIITTPYGEMKHYFHDGENAIVATDYSVEALRKAFDALADGKYDTAKLRRNAYETGKQFFNVNSYRIPLNEFLNGIVNCKL